MEWLDRMQQLSFIYKPWGARGSHQAPAGVHPGSLSAPAVPPQASDSPSLCPPTSSQAALSTGQ